VAALERKIFFIGCRREPKLHFPILNLCESEREIFFSSLGRRENIKNGTKSARVDRKMKKVAEKKLSGLWLLILRSLVHFCSERFIISAPTNLRKNSAKHGNRHCAAAAPDAFRMTLLGYALFTINLVFLMRFLISMRWQMSSLFLIKLD
jgi:hypothetical protein